MHFVLIRHLFPISKPLLRISWLLRNQVILTFFFQQIGWLYGSVTEDLLTGFNMHCRGWKSVYCMPKKAAFKGSAPINLSDRLHQVLKWASGSTEIFFSGYCPLWYGYGGKLKWLQRLAYTNSVVYPFTSIPLYLLYNSSCLSSDWKVHHPHCRCTIVNLLHSISLNAVILPH